MACCHSGWEVLVLTPFLLLTLPSPPIEVTVEIENDSNQEGNEDRKVASVTGIS